MTRFNSFKSFTAILLALSLGCDSAPPPAPSAASGSKPDPTMSTAVESSKESSETASVTDAKPKRKSFKPVEIGGSSGGSSESSSDSGEKFANVRAALKPLQILIGNWNGTSRNAVLDQPGWAWDLKTDPKQPALKFKSEKGKYIREGRLTFLTTSQEFEFAATDGEGKKHLFRGTFSEPVQDVPGDDKKLQRTYKLKLTETEADANGEQWQLVINQQENNRYILEVDRKRGSSQFNRIDTINTQREGTSFALSDTDYGEKTCIVSQGLGTIEVKHDGKSYWVCCSGCKAAFDDEPTKWIAKFEEMKKGKGMK